MKEKKSWMQSVFAYAEKEEDGKFRRIVGTVGVGGAVSVLLHVSCDLLITADAVTTGGIVTWCLGALAAYLVKILAFRLRYARGRDRQ